MAGGKTQERQVKAHITRTNGRRTESAQHTLTSLRPTMQIGQRLLTRSALPVARESPLPLLQRLLWFASSILVGIEKKGPDGTLLLREIVHQTVPVPCPVINIHALLCCSKESFNVWSTPYCIGTSSFVSIASKTKHMYH